MFSVAMQGKNTCSKILQRASMYVQGRCKLVVLMEYQSTFFFFVDHDHEWRRGGKVSFPAKSPRCLECTMYCGTKMYYR